MKITPTKIFHYGLLLVAAYIVYSWFVKGGGSDTYENHPRNKDKFKDIDEEVQGKGHRYADEARHIRAEDEPPKSKNDLHKKVERHTKPDVEKEPEQKDRYKFEEQNPNIQRLNPEDIKEEEEDAILENADVELEDNKEKVEEELMEFEKLKVKKKEEDGEDLLKDFNAAFRDPDIHEQIDRLSDHKNVKIPKLKKEWHEEHDDIETAEDKTRRRRAFFERVRRIDPNITEDEAEDTHIHESRDDFVFVTAAWGDTYKAALTFIHSVQMNFQRNTIGILDFGLSQEQVTYLKSLCKVEVVENYLTIFPEHLRKNLGDNLWRPIAIQLALPRFGHFVWVEPGRYFKRAAELRGHYALSRKGGVAMFGNVKGYSTAVVTHPEMYYYLAINVRKLMKLPHMEITMMIMHNSDHLRHYFLRWLGSCANEEYCIAPPGSKRKCDQNMYPKSKRYADCHRYDESAINILLASWHNYDWDHYAAADYVTRRFDGRDATQYLKVCSKKQTREL